MRNNPVEVISKLARSWKAVFLHLCRCGVQPQSRRGEGADGKKDEIREIVCKLKQLEVDRSEPHVPEAAD